MQLKTNFHYIDQYDMRCDFCFNRIKSCNDDDKIFQVFTKLLERTKSINLVGGEIFININLLYRLVELGLKKNATMSLVTNGLLLSKNIKNKKVRFIFENVDMVGISIDSFNPVKLKHIGRCNTKKETLSIKDLENISELCKSSRTTLKINTVVTKKNYKDNMYKTFKTQLKGYKFIWKQLMVATSNPKYKITKQEFNSFVTLNAPNKKDEIIVKPETNQVVLNSYVMVDSEGYYIYDQNKRYKQNVDNVKLEDLKHFEYKEYVKRYKTIPTKVDVSSSFVEELNSLKNKRLLFFDVEALSQNSKMKDVHKLQGHDIPFLWTAVLVDDKTNKIIKKFDSYIKKDKLNSPEELYDDFFNILDRNKVDKIIVSGGGLEKTFLTLCLHFAKKNKDSKKISILKEARVKLYDIQKVLKSKSILINGSGLNYKSTRKVLDLFREIYPEYVQYSRQTHKGNKTSSKIPFVARAAYEGRKSFEATMDITRDYCFDDVYDDYQIYLFYKRLVVVSKTINKRIKTKKINLHMHSKNGEGKKNNKDIIDLCIKEGIEVMSITNLNTTKGQKECIEYAKDKNITYVPGIKLTGTYGNVQFHILGYNIDINKMKKLNYSFEKRTIESSQDFIKRLIKKGYKVVDNLDYYNRIITIDVIAELLKKQLKIYKQDCYELINKIGYDQLFHPSVEDVIKMIHDSEGIAILAHPYNCVKQLENKKIANNEHNLANYINEFKKMGLDGIEALYHEYDFIKQKKLVSIAKEKGLLITTGTDYNGKKSRNVIKNEVDTKIEGLIYKLKK